MKNLASADKARNAKLRVKHDIFAPWEEDIDHGVFVMYTPMINEEKHDFVGYTSLGFLSHHQRSGSQMVQMIENLPNSTDSSHGAMLLVMNVIEKILPGDSHRS